MKGVGGRSGGEERPAIIEARQAGNSNSSTALCSSGERLLSGLRFAVSFDEGAPQIVNLHADASDSAWGRNVMDEAVSFTTSHVLAKPGAHVLKFWALDAGVVLNKLTIDAGGLKPSYPGPPESPRVGR